MGFSSGVKPTKKQWSFQHPKKSLYILGVSKDGDSLIYMVYIYTYIYICIYIYAVYVYFLYKGSKL